MPEGTLFCSGLSFRIWAAVFSYCRLVITRDCGPVHVAAALGVPTVSVFEETKRREHTRWEAWDALHANIFRPDLFQPALLDAHVNEVVVAGRKLLQSEYVIV